MGRKRIKRRQSHGSAWHWKQTDAWYYTMPGTKKRFPLFDESGSRVRGKENREAAELALAKEKLTWSNQNEAASTLSGPLLVARVCNDYLQYCEQGQAKGEISKGHRTNSEMWLKDLCRYCGALLVTELKVNHVQKWMDSHAGWKSSDTRRSVISVVQAAFNRSAQETGIANPLKSLKKPASKPRLASFSPTEEQALYSAAGPAFGNFLFGAIHTGLRPFSELAKLTANEVEVTPRGMMWHVYATKTDKPRKIPVRPEVAELTKGLMKSAPRNSGLPLFRTTRDRPWKSTNGVVRFLDLKKKLKWDTDPVKGKYSCYTARHTFAHRMLSGYWNSGVGCSIETLAELLGDTPKVAFDHYGKEWSQHYQDPLWKAIGAAANVGAGNVERRAKRPSANKESRRIGSNHGAAITPVRPTRAAKKNSSPRALRSKKTG